MKHSYLEKIRKYYPAAGYATELGDDVIRYIRQEGFAPHQVMAANSVCSDDLVTMQFTEAHKDLLGPFNMGGLNGFPFTGLTGLGAFTHHAPDKGALLIIYAPHIGIPLKGDPGFVIRPGQKELSSCCGASIGALTDLGIMPPPPHVTKAAKSAKPAEITTPLPVPALLDTQYEYIRELYRQNEGSIRGHRHPIIPATEIMYRDIDARLTLLVQMLKNQLSSDLKGKHLFLAGGIFINTDDGHPACAVLKKLTHVYLKGNKQVEEEMTEGYRKFLHK